MKLFGIVVYALANSALSTASPAALNSASSNEISPYPGLGLDASACDPLKCLACITQCAKKHGNRTPHHEDDSGYKSRDECVEKECLPEICLGCDE
ncbi:hypothetical protein GGR57DRAFT_502708 [Xylariaceae sp. FL1272]|nr:hypothetical protein GGR57DRAFT_502708 [Xylariaceae sp. FL1272]